MLMNDANDQTKTRALIEKLKTYMALETRLIKSGRFGLDPDTGTLFFDLDLNALGVVPYPIPLGLNTNFYRLAEFMVKRNGLPATHKEMYEYVFGEGYDDDSTFEPNRKLQYLIRDFKELLKEHLVDKQILKNLFKNAYRSGYTCNCG